MKILVTGAAGFLGRMLVADLSRRQSLTVDGEEQPIEAILAADLDTGSLADLAAQDPRIDCRAGALSSAETLDWIAAAQPGLVVHLAAVVSGAAEADFDLGMQVNLASTLDLINCCRGFAAPSVLLFSSSVAIFSCAGNDTIDETRLPEPKSSYGTQKLIGELLVRDCSRKGFLRGRTLRFPTISVRPGKPNKAASSFASGIIREPLAGIEADLPVGPDLRLHLASPEAALRYILHGAAITQAALNGETTITLPGISVTVAEMLSALSEVAGPEVAARVKPRPDPAVEAIVASWPGEIRTPRALALGFRPDPDFAELVRLHIARMQAV